jgi:hypothetical protein
MRFRWKMLGLVAAAFLALPHADTHAAAAPKGPAKDSAQVDVALVLAVDVSLSIDEGEAGIQRRGYEHALRDKRVADAIRSGFIGRIAVSYVEWSAPTDQRVIIPWRIIGSADDANAFAEELERAPYKSGSTTSISAGIDFAVKHLDASGITATRRVIDVSGDGYSDYGRPVKTARNDAVKAGVTINGLAIMNERPKWKQAVPADLDTYYRDNVIGGRGSFYLAAKNLEDFSQSVLHKLVLEIADRGQDAPPG